MEQGYYWDMAQPNMASTNGRTSLNAEFGIATERWTGERGRTSYDEHPCQIFVVTWSLSSTFKDEFVPSSYYSSNGCLLSFLSRFETKRSIMWISAFHRLTTASVVSILQAVLVIWERRRNGGWEALNRIAWTLQQAQTWARSKLRIWSDRYRSAYAFKKSNK